MQQLPNYFKQLRDFYIKGKVAKILFVLESPPKSSEYFYDDYSKTALFIAIMKVLNQKFGEEFNINKHNKKELLNSFTNKGFMIIDSTYATVNGIKNKKSRNSKILEYSSELLKDLKAYTNKESKIILIKSNIYDLYADILSSKGYKILNEDIIPFPSFGHQRRFNEILINLL